MSCQLSLDNHELLLLATAGDAQAQFCLALRYGHGEGLQQYWPKAVYWYARAANQGDTRAQVNLAGCYASGDGVAQSDAHALHWLRLAAERGDVRAQFSLGICCFEGLGVPVSSEAVKWLRMAAEQGHAEAQFWLGVCYVEGVLVARSAAEAEKWFRRAADQGVTAVGPCLVVCATATPRFVNGYSDEHRAEDAFDGVDAMLPTGWRVTDGGIWMSVPSQLPVSHGRPETRSRARLPHLLSRLLRSPPTAGSP